VRRCVLPGMALALLGLAAAKAGGPLTRGEPQTAPSPSAVVRVQGEACTDACRRDHSNCMIREKGSPTCNITLQRCLQACLAGKRRP
jgi:hypothetical protein